MTSLENLRIEYKKEKNSDVRIRMLGVLFVKVDKKIRSWQRRTKEIILRLKRRGYTIAIQDESILRLIP